ncbi:baculoviral IAP repeat-containing protein 7-like [Thrips palmi]|uniref:Baculoviral IAP repeat-containing protein 7-like n=1 Tax=Thrips palmi TaxID=161013 RepID=A0A6P8Z0N6_THRPL|nr:baculoviral IAP repeat-containing protein 7-like [Thrips palmi]
MPPRTQSPATPEQPAAVPGPAASASAPLRVRVNPYASLAARLRSFEGFDSDNVSVSDLAEAGFYWTGVRDDCVCFSCGLGVRSWELGDVPVNEHLRFNPHCPHIRHIRRGFAARGPGYLNEYVRLRSDQFPAPLFGIVKKLTPIYVDRRTYDIYVDRRTYDQRFNSYGAWPVAIMCDKGDMAAAGLFYTKLGDRVQCAFCGVEIDGWYSNSDPWVRHARLKPTCAYVLTVRGSQFVQNAVDSPVAPPPAMPPPPAVVEQASSTVDKKNCIMCYEKVLSVTFLPCAHLCCCDDCWTAFDRCPMCREEITTVLKVFLP